MIARDALSPVEARLTRVEAPLEARAEIPVEASGFSPVTEIDFPPGFSPGRPGAR